MITFVTRDYILTKVVYSHVSLRLIELLNCELLSNCGHNHKLRSKFYQIKLILTDMNNEKLCQVIWVIFNKVSAAKRNNTLIKCGVRSSFWPKLIDERVTAKFCYFGSSSGQS